MTAVEPIPVTQVSTRRIASKCEWACSLEVTGRDALATSTYDGALFRVRVLVLRYVWCAAPGERLGGTWAFTGAEGNGPRIAGGRAADGDERSSAWPIDATPHWVAPLMAANRPAVAGV